MNTPTKPNSQATSEMPKWIQKFDPPNQTRDCEHRNHARSCILCEHEHEIFDLSSRLNKLTKAGEALADENKRLKAVILENGLGD
jgi:hypothetical protein